MCVHRVLRFLIFKRSIEMKNVLLTIFIFAISGVNSSYAFQFNPTSEPNASGLYEIPSWQKKLDLKENRIPKPIHENATIKALRTAKIPDSLKNNSVFLSEVVKGVRWNDNPLDADNERPLETIIYFTESCRKLKSSKIDARYDLLYRSHCGDMQFLHAMASKKTENAGATSELINMWAEFSYKVAAGDISKDILFENVGNKLEKRSAELFNIKITDNGRRRMEWQPEWLFTFECNRNISTPTKKGDKTTLKCKDKDNQFSEETIQNIALGSLLHILQDSFSASHVLRESSIVDASQTSKAGRVKQFAIYSDQNAALHCTEDLNIEERKELLLNDLSARLIELVINQRFSGQDNWDETKKVINEAFNIINTSVEPDDIGYGATIKR